MSVDGLHRLKVGNTEPSKPSSMIPYIVTIAFIIIAGITCTTYVFINRVEIDAAIQRNNERQANQQNNNASMVPQAMHWWLFNARR